MAKVVTHNIDNIPDELKVLEQWVGWNNTKFPINVRIGNKAEVDNPETWASFEKAREAVLSGKYKGAGFVLTESDPYVFTDLDHVRNPETGEIKPEAQVIIDLLDSYTEVSQSGTGIHIIIRGKKLGERCRTGNIEIYDHARYFALTGDILGGRSTIEDCQEQLDKLYADTFGGDKISGNKPIGDLVLDRDAQPPQIKLEDLRRRKGFPKTWEHKRDDLPSLSEYDLSLANYAARDGWNDQEMADLIIAFRRRHGDDKDLKKALRLDYISGVIGKVRHSDVLELLPFKAKRLIQLGTEDAEYILELENGTSINMGETASFLSPRRAYQRLYDAGHILSPSVVKRWPEIVIALRLLVKVEPTITKLQEVEQWIMTFLTRGRLKPRLVDSEAGIGSAMSSDSEYDRPGIVIDEEGRLFIHIISIIAHARMTLGQNLSSKALAGHLRRMGFRNLEAVSIRRGEARSQISVWVSPAGFVPDELIVGRVVEETPLLAKGKGHIIEDDDGDYSPMKQSPLEKVAKELREEREERDRAPYNP